MSEERRRGVDRRHLFSTYALLTTIVILGALGIASADFAAISIGANDFDVNNSGVFVDDSPVCTPGNGLCVNASWSVGDFVSNVDGNGFNLTNLSTVAAVSGTINGASICTAVNGLCNQSAFVLSAFTQNVDGNGFNLTNVSHVSSSSLTVDTSTLYIDSSNNRVGIGTTSPSAALDVTQSGSTTGVEITNSGTGNSLVISSSGTSGNNRDIYIERPAAIATNRESVMIYSNQAETAGLQLVQMVLNNAASTIPVLKLRNEGTGNGLFIDQNANGVALNIDSTGGGAAIDVNDGDIVNVGQVNLNRADATISAGAITITETYQRVATEASAATDDLDTINGGSDGDLLIIRTIANTRTVVAKDGTGNLALAGDFTLDNTEDRLMLQYDASTGVWAEISRSNNT